jgi:His/Glu/Gln/Arg/opine family amino acid ABC transporter permease subunit
VSELQPYVPQFLDGVMVTIRVASLSILFAIGIALVLGLTRGAHKRVLRYVSLGTIELSRGASVIVYVFWAFYVLPVLPLGIQLEPFTLGVVMLAFVLGSYGAEVVRGAIDAVPQSQLDAAHALGLPRLRVIAHVVIPQAMPQVVPAFSSLSLEAIKGTAIVGFIGVHDVFYVANATRMVVGGQTILIYTLLMLTYCALCFAASCIFRGIEYLLPLNRAIRAASRRDGRVSSSLDSTSTTLEVQG